MKTLPRILFISQHWPHRDATASELRSLHTRRALEKIGDVSVIVLDAEEGGAGWNSNNERNFDLMEAVPVHPHLNRTTFEKLRWAFDSRSPYGQGRSVAVQGTQRILEEIEKFDLIWFSKIRTASMLAHWAWPRSVLDIDDIPSLFESSVLQNGGSPLQQARTWMRRLNWRRREKLLSERFDMLAVCSEEDKHYLQSLGITSSIHVIPNGFEEPVAEPARNPSRPPRIGFVGIFDYYPNVEGINWFVRECWPHIKRKYPEVELRLAGRNTEGAVLPSGKDIEVLGWVQDIDSEVATWSLMVVPLHKGAGTRGKIAYAFSRRCPIVSTSLGAYGYEVDNEREIVLADDPVSFANACLRLLQQPEEATKMAERANKKFLEKWTWSAIQPRVWAAAEDCLRKTRDVSTPRLSRT